jgi:hypothetical protein
MTTKMKISDFHFWQSLYRNEQGNAKALLRHVVKLEKKLGTFDRGDWSDWLDQYGVKA